MVASHKAEKRAQQKKEKSKKHRQIKRKEIIK